MMQQDVTELRDFYIRPLGQIVRRLLLHRLRARWRHVEGETLIGLGFASPYLGAFRNEAMRVGAFMPAGQGALAWPQNAPRNTVLVDDYQLPLPDNAVDKLLAVHCLESAERVGPLLREMWRILAPQGRLMMIVPNRASIWSRFDSTPFGHGRPFSRAQLERLLADALFTPMEWTNALYVPPFERNVLIRSATAFERIGARFSPRLGGVIIVEARKELSAPAAVRSETRRRITGIAPVSAGSTSRRDECSKRDGK